VTCFAQRYLAFDAAWDRSTAELWIFYQEIAEAGDLEPVTKSAFLRALPIAMATTFGVKKSHAIRREGHSVRGFKSITIREDSGEI